MTSIEPSKAGEGFVSDASIPPSQFKKPTLLREPQRGIKDDNYYFTSGPRKSLGAAWNPAVVSPRAKELGFIEGGFARRVSIYGAIRPIRAIAEVSSFRIQVLNTFITLKRASRLKDRLNL